MYKIRMFLLKLKRLPSRLMKVWPYIKFYLKYADDMEYNHIIIGMLSLQLKQITKEIMSDEFYDKKKHDLKLLWECRQALENYTSSKIEDEAFEIDNSLFIKKFKTPIPDITIKRDDNNTMQIFYLYPDTIDEETKQKMEAYLHSEERKKIQTDSFRSLNTAYLQDFVNKLGAVIDSFDY